MKRIFYFFAICMCGFVSINIIAATRSDKSDINKNLNIFTSIYKELQRSYVDTIDANKTMRTAIDAMLYTIDPYTEYIPKEEQEEFKRFNKGNALYSSNTRNRIWQL